MSLIIIVAIVAFSLGTFIGIIIAALLSAASDSHSGFDEVDYFNERGSRDL